jgi:hypothetical protein
MIVPATAGITMRMRVIMVIVMMVMLRGARQHGGERA